jgi:hypothetical protein
MSTYFGFWKRVNQIPAEKMSIKMSTRFTKTKRPAKLSWGVFGFEGMN